MRRSPTQTKVFSKVCNAEHWGRQLVIDMPMTHMTHHKSDPFHSPPIDPLSDLICCDVMCCDSSDGSDDNDDRSVVSGVAVARSIDVDERWPARCRREDSQTSVTAVNDSDADRDPGRLKASSTSQSRHPDRPVAADQARRRRQVAVAAAVDEAPGGPLSVSHQRTAR